MQTGIVCAAVALLIVYTIRCAFIYGRRTSNMPAGEQLCDHNANAYSEN